MPPEQVRAEDNLDQRADVWAMGVTIYELVTGKLPFGG
jgi:serine/threonine-protein kinase